MSRLYRERLQLPLPFRQDDFRSFLELLLVTTKGEAAQLRIRTNRGEVRGPSVGEAFDQLEPDEKIVDLVFSSKGVGQGDLDGLKANVNWDHFDVGDQYATLSGQRAEEVEQAAAVLRRFVDESRPADQVSNEPLDDGAVLLQPISVREYEGIESLLAALWRRIEAPGLSDVQRHQIVAMAELIQSEHRLTEPGRTPRWRLIGVVRGALRHLVGTSSDLLATTQLAEILLKINWSNLAQVLPG